MEPRPYLGSEAVVFAGQLTIPAYRADGSATPDIVQSTFRIATTDMVRFMQLTEVLSQKDLTVQLVVIM